MIVDQLELESLHASPDFFMSDVICICEAMIFHIVKRSAKQTEVCQVCVIQKRHENTLQLSAA